MNPLEKYPNLFINGRFKVKTPDGLVRTLNPVALYVGVIGDHYLKTHDVYECTLIARHISDMSDTEIVWHKQNSDHPLLEPENGYTKERIQQMREGNLNWHDLGITATDMLNYLSIGVYPFDLSHFEDGTVININEV